MFFSAPKNKRIFPCIRLTVLGVFGMITFGFSQTILTNDDFESNFGNWNDGGIDVHRINENSIVNLDEITSYECVGTLSGMVVRLRDNSDSNSSLISNKFDFSNFNSVAVSYDFFVASMDTVNEDWFLELSSDNGNNWTTIKQYVKGVDFDNNDCGPNNYGVKETVTFNNNNYTFNTQNKLRLRCDAGQNADYIFIDNLSVTGYELGGTTNLFNETFEGESNNAASGTDAGGINWYTDNGDNDATEFFVHNQGTNKEFHAINNSGLGTLYTDTIDISTYTDLIFSIVIDRTQNLSSTDYIQFSYRLDNASEKVTIDKINDDISETGLFSYDLSDVRGDQIQLYVEIYHSSTSNPNVIHEIDNIQLSGTAAPIYEWLGYSFDNISKESRWSTGSIPDASSIVKIASDNKLVLKDDYEFYDLSILDQGNLTIRHQGSLIIHDDVDVSSTGFLKCYSIGDTFGSIIVNGDVTGVLKYHRWINNFEGTNANGNDVVSSPVTGESWYSLMTENTLDDGTNRIYNNGTLYSFTPYLNGFDGWGNYYTNTTEATIETGQGYRAATFQGNSAAVKFTGTVQTGTVNVTLRRVNNPWNVVGNPYPSYISLSDFLSANAAVLDDSKVYVLAYNGLENDSYWTYYNTNDAAGVYIAPGQGFYVAAKSDNATLTFTPSMRTIQGDDDFIDGRSVSVQNTIYKFKLNINSGDNNRHTKFYFRDTEAVSEDFDRAYDGVLKEDGDNFKLYSKLITNSETEKLAFQTAPISSLSESSIAIGVNMTSGQQFTFSLKDVDIPQETLVYLEDRDKDTWTLLNDGNSYVINTSETISGSGRFFLHFEPNDALSNKDIDLNEVGIKAIHNTKQIIISGQLAEDTNVTIYDINGKTILKTTIDAYNTNNRIDVKNLITGIYLVQLNNNSQTVSKQILVK